MPESDEKLMIQVTKVTYGHLEAERGSLMHICIDVVH